MGGKESVEFRQVIEELQTFGFLLLSDAALPSVASLVAREPIRGSWWGHPRSHAIFQVTEQLADHPDVIAIKLISGKVTYVHRSLWPALYSVAVAREPWQLDGLSPAAQSLLSKVMQEGVVRTDQLPESRGAKSKVLKEAVLELERNLLTYSEEVHTETGAHEKALDSWEGWAERVGLRHRKMSVERAKKGLEQRLTRLNTGSRVAGKVPWT
jgi:hypothetical protein